MRMNADGSGLDVYAGGERTSVGFDWHPQTKGLWFADNGLDMPDDSPLVADDHAGVIYWITYRRQARSGCRFRAAGTTEFRNSYKITRIE